MCIALVSTTHPQYAFILASNRDEFLSRPTAPAHWWDSPNSHVLGGRDLARPIRGTWLGITRQGHIACLTNYREAQTRPISELKSRGAIALSYLTQPPEQDEPTAAAARRIIEDDGVNDVGGFSLLFGRLRRPDSQTGKREPLAIVSNRTPDVHGVTWVASDAGAVFGLSNARFGDGSWPKVRDGEKRLQEITMESEEGKERLVARLMDLLSVDTLPNQHDGEAWDSYVLQLRNSIFIPRVGGQATELTSDELHAANGREEMHSAPIADEHGLYGTQKQTVILVDHDGHVTFVERTLHAGSEEKATKAFEFDIEGW